MGNQNDFDKITNVGEDADKREPFYTAGRNVNWYSHHGKQHGGLWKKLKIELPYDLAIPVPVTYQKTTRLIWKGTFTSMFIPLVFTLSKVWMQPQCPSTDEPIKEMCYICIYIMKYYPSVKMNDICNNIDCLGQYCTKRLQTKTNTVWYHLYVKYKKINYWM